MGDNNLPDVKAQILYFSHGSGPLPILGDPSHAKMVAFLGELRSMLRRPDSILVISAHWEEAVATLQGAAKPAMLYDYYGFPEESYRITYPAPGNPHLARRIADLLENKNIPSAINDRRGFDHGLFIPLNLMYPEADIPSLQISLLHSLDPDRHIALGKALAPLLNENILIFGSGFSFHNLRAFRMDGGADRADPRNDAFQDWLIETCTGPAAPGERERRLVDWESAPNARYCHPREEHLLPLHVCAGLAGRPAAVVFDDYISGMRALALRW
jgi:4,5-DOPA dioxygenase extradiol